MFIYVQYDVSEKIRFGNISLVAVDSTSTPLSDKIKNFMHHGFSRVSEDLSVCVSLCGRVGVGENLFPEESSK